MCIEKRFNFTLDEMSVTAPAYDHFRSRLASLTSGSPANLTAEQLDISELQVSSRPDIQSPDIELWHLHYARQHDKLYHPVIDTHRSDLDAKVSGPEPPWMVSMTSKHDSR